MNEEQKTERGKLELVDEYRQPVLLASSGAFLHNLGKVSSEFNLHQLQVLGLTENEPRKIKKFYFYQQIIGLLREDAVNSGFPLHKIGPANFGKEHDVSEQVFAQETKSILAGSLGSLMKPFNDQDYRLGDFIEYLGQGSSSWGKIYRTGTQEEDTIKVLLLDPSKKLNIESIRGRSSLLTHVMNRCHDRASGGEKNDFYWREQIKSKSEIVAFESTPFGFEKVNATNVFDEYNKYRKTSEAILQAWQPEGLLKSDRLNEVFRKVLADSRRPFNNVSVYDIGHSGMAFLKSIIWTLAESSLSHKDLWQEELLRWRILGFRLDGLEYLSQAVSISDFRVRKNKLDQFLNKAAELLEEQFPVATEVYRDENGSLLIFPDWGEDSVEYKVLQEKYRLLADDGLLLPAVFGLRPLMKVSEDGYVAHPKAASPKNENGKKYIGKELKDNWIVKTERAEAVIPKILGKAENDLCPYCGLRLIGTGAELLEILRSEAKKLNSRASERKTCAVCMVEKAGAAQNWWQNDNRSTIWMGELADNNGRVALIAGRFYPEIFLELDYLPAERSSKEMIRADSFARSRRVWECCSDFWQEIIDRQQQSKTAERKVLSGHLCICEEGENLHHYYAYELEKDGIRVSVVRTSQEEFVTTENLERTSNSRGPKLKDLLIPGSEWKVILPGGYGKKSKIIATFTLETSQSMEYLPVLNILTAPRTFMMLVPAADAFNVITGIKKKYDQEMGKVRSRLPLTLGVVFAGVYTPLRVLLDAGRRMLQRQPDLEEWTVEKVAKDSEVIEIKATEKMQLGQKPCTGRWVNIEMTVPDRPQAVTWDVGITLGGTNKTNCVNDEWYPYVPAAASATSARSDCLPLDPLPDNIPSVEYMIHVEKLNEQGKDKLQVYPSTFDFEFLNSGGVRFEIAYQGKTRLGQEKSHRPYLLEEITVLEEIGELLKGGSLKRNQIYSLREIIAGKRQEWDLKPEDLKDNGMFWRFCRDLLVTAEWLKVGGHYPWQRDNCSHNVFFDRWATYAAAGWFEDAVELYLQILKEKVG